MPGFEHHFPPHPEKVPIARHAVGQWLASNRMVDDDAIAYDVLMVVTELIANAVIHNGGQDVILRLEATPEGSSVRVEVVSYATGRAIPDARGSDTTDYGRGLQIVSRLSDHWVTSQGARRVDNCLIPI